MPALILKLWSDEVGSTISTEMALVTGVTVGAMIMSMGQFSNHVNREFREASRTTSLMTIDDLNEQKAKEQALHEAEFREKKAEVARRKDKSSTSFFSGRGGK